jgi:hypothetical protein
MIAALVQLCLGTSYTNVCYSYNAFWTDVLPALGVICNGFEVETLLNVHAAKAGLKVSELPSFEQERVHGASKLHPFRDGTRVLRTILRERFSRAPRQHDPVSRSFSELGLDIGEDGARALAQLVRVGTTPSIQNLVGYGF